MSNNIKYIILVIIFFILQAVWFNQVLLFGTYAPIIFLYPLLILPVYKNEIQSLFMAFLLGLGLDITNHTGGVFAATAVFVVYIRKFYFLIGKGPTQDLDQIRVSNLGIAQKVAYYFTFIFLSQLLIYGLESFNLKLLISKLGYIFINSVLSLFFFILIDYLFFNTQNK